jgi:hypothetical protein
MQRPQKLLRHPIQGLRYLGLRYLFRRAELSFRQPKSEEKLGGQQDDHALTALATSPQLRPAPASRTSPTGLVAEQIKIESRPID